MSLSNQSHLFDIESQKIYLNSAAYTPLLNAVVDAGQESVKLKARPYHIVPKIHFFDQVDEVRSLICQLINAEDKDTIAMIPAASYGMAIVAANLHRWPNIGQKKKIYIIDQEFPNDVYAFERVCESLHLDIITLPQADHYNQVVIDNLDEEVAMIVIPHVHWITGYKFDLPTIAAQCRKMGIMLVIDGTQSIGALPFDVQDIKPDALICATYKWLLGPYGQAFAYLSKFFHDGIPLEESWINRVESDNFAALLSYQKEYRPMAQRYNVGEYSQFIQIPMLKVALQQILEWKVANIQQYCHHISEDVLVGLMSSGIALASEIDRVNHLFSLKFQDENTASQLYTRLSKESIFVSLRANCIRVSPHVFNSREDIEKLGEVVK